MIVLDHHCNGVNRGLKEEGERLVLEETGPSPALSEKNSLPNIIHFGFFQFRLSDSIVTPVKGVGSAK